MHPEMPSEVQLSLQRIGQHPFVLEASQRSLRREAALRWIFCAGRESRTFPRLLERLLRTARSERLASVLRANLNDELGNGNPDDAHFMHYLALLRDLEVAREEFERYQEKSGIRLALELAETVAECGNEPLSLGYILVNEAITPVTYRAAQQALEPYFPGLNTRFFDLHVEVDAAHVQDLQSAIDTHDESSRLQFLFGISLGERGMLSLLDEAYGVFDKREVS